MCIQSSRLRASPPWPHSSRLDCTVNLRQTVTGERTSYSEFDGSSFSDGKQRKVGVKVVSSSDWSVGMISTSNTQLSAFPARFRPWIWRTSEAPRRPHFRPQDRTVDYIYLKNCARRTSAKANVYPASVGTALVPRGTRISLRPKHQHIDTMRTAQNQPCMAYVVETKRRQEVHRLIPYTSTVCFFRIHALD